MSKRSVNACEYINIKEIGERIKQSINNSEYETQKEYEEKTNTPSVQNQVKGNSIMNIDKLAGFCKNLGVSADYLLFGENKDNDNSANNDFIPDNKDITIQGIYYAINYLLVAFGDDIISDVEIPYEAFDNSEGYPIPCELTVPALAIYNNSLFSDDDKPTLNGISKYLNFIKNNQNVKRTMLESGLYSEYINILKRKSKIDILEYDKFFNEVKEIEEIVRDDDDLPFKVNLTKS